MFTQHYNSTNGETVQKWLTTVSAIFRRDNGEAWSRGNVAIWLSVLNNDIDREASGPDAPYMAMN